MWKNPRGVNIYVRHCKTSSESSVSESQVAEISVPESCPAALSSCPKPPVLVPVATVPAFSEQAVPAVPELPAVLPTVAEVPAAKLLLPEIPVAKPTVPKIPVAELTVSEFSVADHSVAL